MKTPVKILLAGTLLVISSTALAECPLSMPEDILIECLTVEGSGENYQDYQLKLAEELADMEEVAREREAKSEETRLELTIVH